MSKRKDPLIEFRDYYNSLGPDAQDVARRLLFGETKQRPKSSPTAQPARRQSSSKTRKVDEQGTGNNASESATASVQ